MSNIAVDTSRPSTGKTLGQLWGILFLGFIFGTGAWRLIAKFSTIYQAEPPTNAMHYAIYALLLVLGVGKAEFLFRRKLIQRTLARARDALGETGWRGDYLLAPFCMFSFYRPWAKKHMIMSWVLVPVMVGLAILFIVGDINPILKGAVDLAIGLALAYAALVYVYYFLRVFFWWISGGRAENSPLPEKATVM